MANFIRLLRKSASDLTRYPGFLLIAWVVVTLSLPLLYRLFGKQALLQGLTLSVLIQAAFVLNVLYRVWGWWSILRVLSAVLLLVWIIQAIIIRSGMPYGDLQYTPLLQPQLLGVPFIIPVTWLMMLPPAWVIARLITRRLSGCLLRPLFVLVSGVAFTGWMIYFDPLMARIGVLLWSPPGNFVGTPGLNYLFWFFIAALVTFAISPQRVPGGPLLLMYILSWVVLFIVLIVFGGLLLPALIGFTVMGGMVVVAAIVTP